jgi:hypothetical protein
LNCVPLQFGEEPRCYHNCQVVSIGKVVEADRRAYDVTGISPQSRTVAQLLNGFVSSGTLYPPLKPTLREPMRAKKGISVYAVGGLTKD